MLVRAVSGCKICDLHPLCTVKDMRSSGAYNNMHMRCAQVICVRCVRSGTHASSVGFMHRPRTRLP
eukprot:6187409-Pleurochrysis_carterae.AAC.2